MLGLSSGKGTGEWCLFDSMVLFQHSQDVMDICSSPHWGGHLDGSTYK